MRIFHLLLLAIVLSAPLAYAGVNRIAVDRPRSLESARELPEGQVSEFYEPGLAGPFEVGVRRIQVTASHRDDPIDTLIWYPADLPSGAQPYIYNPESKNLMMGMAVEDAPVHVGLESYPGIVFSHGYGAMNFQSIFLTEHLASHGYVVIAPNHPGNNIYDLQVGGMWFGFLLRPLDITAMIDQLDLLDSTAGSFLKDRIDMNRIGMTGHSMGGYTTLAISGAQLNLNFLSARCSATADEMACGIVRAADVLLGRRDGMIDLSDSRVIASAPMAPMAWSPFREAGLSCIDIPIQVHGGDRDQTMPADEQAVKVWEYAQEPKSYLEMYDAGHFSYSDICLFAPRFNGCRPPYIDMDMAHFLINTFITSHFKVYLEDDMRYAPYLSPDYAIQWDEYVAWYEALGL